MPPKDKTADDPALQPTPAEPPAPAAVQDPPADPPAAELGDAGEAGDVPAPAAPEAITTADVAPLLGVTSGRAKEPTPAPFLSEGMRNELEMHGRAVDPASGAVFVKDKETGEISVTPKA